MVNDSALPATAAALHLTLAVLRRHRAGGRSFSPFVFPSFAFAAAPWLWSTPIGLAAAVLAHIGWFVACEVLGPAAAAAPTAAALAPRAASMPAQTRRRPSSPGPAFADAAVLAVLEETPDIRTFRMARPAGFEFAAGQFVTVRVQIDGKPHVRCYSISSSPDARGYLEISVRRQGVVSSMLHSRLKPGVSVSIGRPAGRFVYPAGDDRPLALVAGGIGITPLLSMLRYALAADPTRPVTLLYSARSDRDVAYISELAAIAERHPQARIAITVTRPAETTRWRTGRIDASMVRQHIADPKGTIFCICGPGPMIADTTRLLRDIGVPDAQVRFEEFETAVAASALQAASAVARVARPPAGVAAGAVQVTFSVSGRTAHAAPSVSLLEAADVEGVAIPSSCRSGVCQSCRTRVLSGEVDCQSDMLDPADREAGFILPCVSWALADCTLEA